MMKRAYFLQLLVSASSGILNVVFVVNLIEGGLSLRETAIALGVLALSTGFLEVPTGFIADKISRKFSVILGLLSLTIAYLVLFFFAASKLSYLAMVILALGNSLISGALEAWLVPLYKRENPDSKNLDNLFLNLQVFSRSGMLLGALIGPALMSTSTSLVWLFASAICLLGLLSSFLVQEIKEKSENLTEDVLVGAKKLGWVNFAFIFYILMACCMGVEDGSKDIIIQNYIVDTNNGAFFMLSFHQTICIFVRISGVLFYKRFLSKLNMQHTFIQASFALFAISSMVGYMTDNYFIFLPFFAAAIFSLGYLFPLLQSHVNSIVNEKYRATALSTVNLFQCIAYAATSFSLAGVITRSNLYDYWLVPSIAMVLAPLFYLLSLKSKQGCSFTFIRQKLPMRFFNLRRYFSSFNKK